MADGNITVEVSTQAAQAELERLRAENTALKRDLQYARDGLTKGRARMREDNERLRAALQWIDGATAATPGLTDAELGRAMAAIGKKARDALGAQRDIGQPAARRRVMQHPTIRTTRMTDRELLQKAARAAGYAIDEDLDRTDVRDNGGGPLKWNPLNDDGDALRLVVALGIHLQFAKDFAVAYAGSVHAKQFTARNGSDPGAATRRAIVRAAAEMAGAAGAA